MKREQADRINDHLLDAWEAMDKARMAIAGLAKAERLKFNGLLHEVVSDLQDKVLLQIWEQYPDLMPPENDRAPPEICSELTWNDVNLPSSVSEGQLDEIILSLLRPQWQKVTALLTNAGKRCEQLGLPVSHGVIAARLRLLSDSDRIEGVGDLRIWGRSEVRLKD
ncbi:hypothetical protein H8A95_38910 [Bradyrhizobium sp. Pear76]|uniref:hypothetical protein n=1 Tax=Bradyrhizobium oropedii TaxID=1571201 RepID=UPI001E630FF2|nr:hypothetical protein [Bradyrhizobium oropedii]MCC8968119.1 hypothetical protein [Bradyrhizobium oropedii]